MDRLSVVAAASAWLVLACNEPESSESALPGRVNAVHAKKSQLADLCDVAPEPARAVSWPELAADSPPLGTNRARYRWVNVWATWCKPCVEELPLLSRTFASWKSHDRAVTLSLLSVDADAQAARDFVRARPELPPSLALRDPAAATTWLTTLGVAAGGSIPVHLVLDAQDKLLCARSGGITATDLEQFERALFR